MQQTQNENGGNMPLSKVLFSFQGRIGRGTFWAVWLSMMVLSLIVGLVGGAAGEDAATVVLVVFMIPLVWVGLAIQVKRWQDMGRSGLMILIGFIPFIGLLIALVWLGCIKGTTGPNKYGDDPLQTPAV
jgi:uncharacterized membrane protein YhaH (DUF805 family)